MNEGRLITLEGIEGAGKTTHIKTIQHSLEAQGINCRVTREPGGTPLGKGIRTSLLSPEHQPAVKTELLLMFADRAEHIDKVIRPALKAGDWVISDRYVDASVAYQGWGRGVPLDVIQQLTQYVCGNLEPDLTLLFDIPVEIACQRIAKRTKKDRFENEEIKFFQQVQRGYHDLLREKPDRWRQIDSTLPLNQVKQIIEKILNDFVKNG